MDTTGYCKLCGKIKRHFCCQTCYEADATKSMKKSELSRIVIAQAEEIELLKAQVKALLDAVPSAKVTK